MEINLLLIFEFNEFSVELVDTKIKQVKVARISKEIFSAAVFWSKSRSHFIISNVNSNKQDSG